MSVCVQACVQACVCVFQCSVFSPDKNKRGKGYIHVIPQLTDDLQPLVLPSQRFTVHEIFC